MTCEEKWARIPPGNAVAVGGLTVIKISRYTWKEAESDAIHPTQDLFQLGDEFSNQFEDKGTERGGERTTE